MDWKYTPPDWIDQHGTIMAEEFEKVTLFDWEDLLKREQVNFEVSLREIELKLLGKVPHSDLYCLETLPPDIE